MADRRKICRFLLNITSIQKESRKLIMFDSYDDILTVKEAREALKIGRNKIYEKLKNKEIKYFMDEGKYYIPKFALIDYVNNKMNVDALVVN